MIFVASSSEIGVPIPFAISKRVWWLQYSGGKWGALQTQNVGVTKTTTKYDKT